ncbi:hypothetical protein KIM372_06490 [Bombiscardovia nodaiensis]|uniref:GPI inositol-deacylase PGAP1-like alpha/beta domain-containing protein n=1 Tax=Bombiscardovia nodaiensis TaxID=2932181 RepID=A0ABM8B7M4_9BIFI|nr:hypothetical protein KIM372_06490 [Bombiscardovia nodaiensis]
MSKQVSASLSGQGLSQADLREFSAIAHALVEAGDQANSLAKGWGQAYAYVLTQTKRYMGLPWGNPYQHNSPGHASFPFGECFEPTNHLNTEYDQLAQNLSTVADGLIQTYSLYSNAESELSKLFHSVERSAFKECPIISGGIAVAVGTVGSAADSVVQGRGLSIDPYDVVHKTRGSHEYFMEGLAGRVTSDPKIAALLAPDGTFSFDHSVNAVSGKLSVFTSVLAHRVQGNSLTVSQVQPQGTFLQSAHSIDQALGNLRKLGDGGSGISYSTIAVQKYRHSDGSLGWVVTIPGTNDQPDSPIGWEQNLELMSNQKDQRMQAASARLVKEAMKRAGVGANDSVALVGHSQGGIAAATLAGDLSQEYRIDHVVTAGSPIANHPIPSKTWVTSIEMDDEVVSSLEGQKNPQRDSWLTVRGNTATVPGNTPAAGRTVVPNAQDHGELSHGMNYQQATWRNAVEQGRPAQRRHDDHFAEITEGELEETDYYQGRMGQ